MALRATEGSSMTGRRVRSMWGDEGTVVRWEPLSSGMCDVLVEANDGSQCWHASSSLKPADAGGPLPSRNEAREAARQTALRQLRVIRRQHIEEFHRPWPGAEFAKALVGKAIDGAIAQLDGRSKA